MIRMVDAESADKTDDVAMTEGSALHIGESAWMLIYLFYWLGIGEGLRRNVACTKGIDAIVGKAEGED